MSSSRGSKRLILKAVSPLRSGQSPMSLENNVANHNKKILKPKPNNFIAIDAFNPLAPAPFNNFVTPDFAPELGDAGKDPIAFSNDVADHRNPTTDSILNLQDPFLNGTPSANPVHVFKMEDNVNDIWGPESFALEASPARNDNPMAIVSPFDVEGIVMRPPEPVVEPPQPAENVVFVPAEEPQEDDAAMPELPLAEGDFDLLEFVVNEALPVNDPEFLALLGTPEVKKEEEPAEQQDEEEDEPAQQDRFFLPALPSGTHSRAPRVRCKTKAAKYRRMRNLNNEASKRCRQNRKLKIGDLLKSEQILTAANVDLTAKLARLSSIRDQVKAHILSKYNGGAVPRADVPMMEDFDIDRLVVSVLDQEHYM